MTISRTSSSDHLYIPQQAQISLTQMENVVHTWYLADGDEAYLIYDNDQLECLFVRGNNHFITPPFFPDSCTLEEAMDLIERYYPVLKQGNIIDFVEYEEEPPNPIMHPEIPFRNILSREKAFYRQPNYIKAGKQELSSSKCMPVSYTWNTEHKVIRIANSILRILILSTGVYKFFHILVGKASLKQPLPALVLSIMVYRILQLIARYYILPATSVKQKVLDDIRSKIALRDQWKYKRVAIEVDGYKIDGVIVGKPSTLDNGRWFLDSCGNGQAYEYKLLGDDTFRQILHKCNSNALVFNYPGVGSSSGLASKQTMVKAYCAMLAFLEDKEKGIGAKEIIGYGFSIGGGIQGEALKTHLLKKEVKYVFIKDRTFSSLSQLVSQMMCRLFAFAVKCLGWEMDSIASSKELQAPEIILQTTKKPYFHQLENIDDLRETDSVIKKKGSLAFALLERGVRENKHYLGIRADHRSNLGEEVIDHLSEIVNQSLAEATKIQAS